MTRVELLKEALDGITAGSSVYWVQEPDIAKCAFLKAIACTLLAKEMPKEDGVDEQQRAWLKMREVLQRSGVTVDEALAIVSKYSQQEE